MQRRRFLTGACGAVTLSMVDWRSHLSADDAACKDADQGLGFSLYGMKDVPLSKALPALREIGYRSVEICCLEGFETDPSVFKPVARESLRQQLVDQQLAVCALMENLPITESVAALEKNRERLQRAMEFAAQLCSATPPVIETVLGGGEWLKVRDRYVAELEQWAKLGEQSHVVVCIKPHRNNAMDRAEHVRWMLERVNSPFLACVYDYSHFIYRDGSAVEFGMRETMEQMLPRSRFVHLKDTVVEGAKFRFDLPGVDPQMDYKQLFSLLRQLGYRGPLCVEVSSQVWKAPGYDAVQAARRSFEALRPALS